MSVETQEYINGMRPGPLTREIPECMRDKYTVVQAIIDVIMFVIVGIGYVIQAMYRTVVGHKKKNLNGAIAVVTGGGGGLGSLIALRLSRLGCTVVLWDINKQDNCTGFTSLFRMNIDHCGVMWALDSGQLEPFGDTSNPCPPTLFAINVNTDTVIGRYPIPSEFVLQDSLITNLVVDSRDVLCRDLHVYMADAWRFGLIVFRDEDKAFWRFNHYTFYPHPLLSNYTLHGLNFQWTDGLFGMSLGNVHQGDRLLYYHAMSNDLEFVVKTSVIRDPSRVNNAVSEFELLGQCRGADGQVSAAAVDRNGVMFFNLVSRDSIGCWDTHKPYLIRNLMIVAQNNRTLVLPNDLRIDHEVPQMVWIITNKLPMFLADVIDPNEFNYRVIYLDPVAAVENSICQP
ncbi:unnamed protein product [Arctia plantaginis]|uniref:Uncharacterized protein n=1 Tax=Arctia plantaginis TaxID=874455 RepID=A0A8S1B226_ARCPL|nr:unnamed protein product [Arctia plantaginis]